MCGGLSDAYAWWEWSVADDVVIQKMTSYKTAPRSFD